MSPKIGSLAFEDVQERASIVEVDFAPHGQLKLRHRESFPNASLDEVVEISGKITISF